MMDEKMKKKWVKVNKEISDLLCAEVEKAPFRENYFEFGDTLKARLATVIEGKKKRWVEHDPGNWMLNFVAWQHNLLWYKNLVGQKGMTLEEVSENMVPRMEYEKDDADFKRGYDVSVGSESPLYNGTDIRSTRSGIWGQGDSLQANARFTKDGKEEKMLLDWLGAGTLVKMIMKGEVKGVKINPWDQGLLYASVERSLDVLVTNNSMASVYDAHPREAIAGLYLLGKLDGIETLEIQATIRRLPALKKMFEMEIAKFYAGFVDAEVYKERYR